MKIDEIGVMESTEGHWEIIREFDFGEDRSIKFTDYKLIFIPGEDYSEEDISIPIKREHLKDLVEMMKNINL